MRKMLLIIGLCLLAVYIYRKFFKKSNYAIGKEKLTVDVVEPKIVKEDEKT